MLKRLLGLERPASDPAALWRAIIAAARRPQWYAEDGVADTLEGRFDMVSAITALVLLRLEQLDAREASARLTERFIADMEGQLREAGVGDLMVGKRMGKLVAALGGRVGAYRDGLAADEAALADAARRNVTFNQDGGDPAAFARRLRAQWAAIERTGADALWRGAFAA